MNLFASPKSCRVSPRGAFWLTPETRIVCSCAGDVLTGRSLEAGLREKMSDAAKGTVKGLPVSRGRNTRCNIVLQRTSSDLGRGREEYNIAVSRDGVVASAATQEGMKFAARALGEMFDGAGFFPGVRVEDYPGHDFRGVLIHMTHYDPRWFRRKRWEKPIDMGVAERVIGEAARCRFNALLIDVADGVVYRGHPELKRHYSRPMRELRRLVRAAVSVGLEVIPKLNFSKSFQKHHHNEWMRPYNRLNDDREYYRHAFALMSELIAVTEPRFFHIGMDEDHEHTLEEYVNKVTTLRNWLAKRGIRTMQWIDIAKRWQPEIEMKMKAAVGKLPRDVILIHWQYFGKQFKEVSWIRRRGYTVLGATGGDDHAATRAFSARAVERGAAGMISTHWVPLQPEREEGIRESMRVAGRAFWEGA